MSTSVSLGGWPIPNQPERTKANGVPCCALVVARCYWPRCSFCRPGFSWRCRETTWQCNAWIVHDSTTSGICPGGTKAGSPGCNRCNPGLDWAPKRASRRRRRQRQIGLVAGAAFGAHFSRSRIPGVSSRAVPELTKESHGRLFTRTWILGNPRSDSLIGINFQGLLEQLDVTAEASFSL